VQSEVTSVELPKFSHNYSQLLFLLQCVRHSSLLGIDWFESGYLSQWLSQGWTTMFWFPTSEWTFR